MFTTDPPSIQQFLDAFKAGVLTRASTADLNEGSRYEIIGGAAAICWSRMVQRDTDLFNNIQTSTAEGDALTDRLQKIYGFDRILDQYGVGTIRLSRTNTSAGGDTFWEGTRVALTSRFGIGDPIYFEVSQDTPVLSAATFAEVPIRATVVGGEVSATAGDDNFPRIVDAIWDPTWAITSLTCSAGTEFENAAVARARARTAQRSKRFGQAQAMIAACAAVGADHVVVFPSNYGGDASDYGLNWVYVGDASFNGSADLVRRCVIALEASRVLGDDLQVGPMVQADLSIAVTVNLVDAPAKFNQDALIERLHNYLIAAVSTDYSYSLDAWKGALFKASPIVQDATFTSPTIDATVLTTLNGVSNFPEQLPRYRLLTDKVTITLKGPK